MKIRISRKKPSQRFRLKATQRHVAVLASVAAIVAGALFFIFNVTKPAQVSGSTETLPSGSFIINMGVTPQTVNNGLKPYGMIYDLIVNYSVPVKWIIEPSKSKDGTDFTYSSTAYKGGPFIISSDYITSSVTSRITYWTNQGVQGVYTTSTISVPVYTTLTSFPRIMIDNSSNNQGIISSYFDNALIPSSAYSTGTPATLTSCYDIWLNPHGDPTWSTHGGLYTFVTTNKSYIWSECHAVSVMESVTNSSSPYQQLNYLTSSGLKCYSNNKCGTVSENHNGNSATPITYYYPTDAAMQFMSTMEGACDGGSEKWYQPISTGGWRSTTRRLVTTADGSSPNEGVFMVYGPAYGNTNYGWVMYEAGHDLDGNGTTTEKVAAQRALFNFVLMAGTAKQMVFDSYTIPTLVSSNRTYNVSVAVSAGSPGYSYAWSSTLGGTFANSAAASTTYTTPTISSNVTGTIKCVVTDACGRKNFVSVPFSGSSNSLPVSLLGFTGVKKDNTIELKWSTASEINNDFFTLDRSANGVDYMQLAKVKGAGNSTLLVNYSYKDDMPHKGDNYYRLTQTDFDGKSETFNAIHIKMNSGSAGNAGTSLIGVYPLPFNDHLKIDYSTINRGLVDFTIINGTGQSIRSRQIEAGSGINSFSFDDLSSLPPGIYFIMMKQGAEKGNVVKVLKI